MLYAAWRAEQPQPAPPPPRQARRADLAASFQQAVVDVLVGKSPAGAAADRAEAAGGRRRRRGQPLLARRPGTDGAEEGAELFIPPLALCTDNAAMAAMAVEYWRQKAFSPLDLDAVPNYNGRSLRSPSSS